MSAMDEKLHSKASVSFQNFKKIKSPLLNLSECNLHNRLHIEQALRSSVPYIPAQFKPYFYQHLYDHQAHSIKHMIYLAQIAFLIYFLADAFIIPDMFFVSGFTRISLILGSVLYCLYAFKRYQDIQILDMILPIATTLCAGAWILILSMSSSPQVSTYIYASCIFVLIANLSVFVQFKLALLCSLLISIFIFAGASQILTASEAFIFSVVYAPIFILSVYLNWNSILNTRRHFLRTLMDEWNYQTLKNLAHTDELTQLYNRRHFVNLAEHSIHQWPQHASSCLLMFDVDHFKKINDSYGHDVGDRVLQIIASTTRKEMRHSDVLARFGGEEFVILLTHTQLQDAIVIAERIRTAIDAQYLYTKPNHTLKFTISVGISELESHTQSLDDLIKKADIALYEAKGRGRNRVEVYHPHMESKNEATVPTSYNSFKKNAKNKMQHHSMQKPSWPTP